MYNKYNTSVGSFFFLGAKTTDGVDRAEHRSNYDFNEVSHYIDLIYPYLVSHYTVLDLI